MVQRQHIVDQDRFAQHKAMNRMEAKAELEAMNRVALNQRKKRTRSLSASESDSSDGEDNKAPKKPAAYNK